MECAKIFKAHGKKKIALPKRVLKNVKSSYSNFLTAIFVEDCFEKLATLKQRYCTPSICYG